MKKKKQKLILLNLLINHGYWKAIKVGQIRFHTSQSVCRLSACQPVQADLNDIHNDNDKTFFGSCPGHYVPQCGIHIRRIGKTRPIRPTMRPHDDEMIAS